MSGLEWVLAALGIVIAIGIASIVTVVLVLRALYRRVRRSRAVGGTVLRTRAALSHGPQRSVLALRVRLAETLASGQSAIDLLASGHGPRGDLPRLFRRIQEESAALDLQLRLMESETDSAVLGESLPAARHRVEQVTGLVGRMRTTVAAVLAGSTDDVLTTLDGDVDREIAALHAGVQELRRLDGHEAPEPIRQPTIARSDRSTQGI
ncbi:hypothetical protein J2X63_002575 [Agromyces sp. 3263]|uniref:hypothetical protein n=1 Tax=Agromyces sp. 3263 TaxID=2817750 RepID=UPI002861D236|nr:hypothetical protein [Agromyces sp. 3263]MDR6906889.1 hypothetical protein [Agromyces sp. 3263]